MLLLAAHDEVIRHLTEPHGLLIFGPGEELDLTERLGRSKPPAERTIDVETTDKLANAQIVAKVKDHFGIDR
jgi:hypothetical protein